MTSLATTGPAPASSVTYLELGAETGCVQTRLGSQTWARREFSLGVDSLVRLSLRHAPPRPVELEHAIELTEDSVMPLADQFTGSNQLVMQGIGAALIAQSLSAGSNGQSALTLDEVEALFNRLVAVTEGRPTSQESLPTDARFIAAMLILREFMHHLQFANVTLQPSREPL